jgi:hypothetical protein
MHRRAVGEEDSVEESQTLNHLRTRRITKAVRDKTFVSLVVQGLAPKRLGLRSRSEP